MDPIHVQRKMTQAYTVTGWGIVKHYTYSLSHLRRHSSEDLLMLFRYLAVTHSPKCAPPPVSALCKSFAYSFCDTIPRGMGRSCGAICKSIFDSR